MLTIPVHEFTPYLPPQCAYIKGQTEVGTGDGSYKHWQILVVFKRKVRLAAVRSVFGSFHAELSRSAAASEYVWKEETRVAGTQFELGELPMKRNSKTDWENVKRKAQGNKLEEIDGDIYVRYYGNLKRIAKDNAVAPYRENIVVEVYYGVTGSGKSHRAFLSFKDKPFYVKGPTSKWWDGYKGEEYVIMDEFRGAIGIEHLLRWFDKYPCYVEEKGGQQALCAKHIIVCSNIPPKEWYPNIDEQTNKALLRRLTCTEFKFQYSNNN